MHSRPRIALIPAFEPGTLMIDLLQRVNQSGFISIVIDDGSGPEFAELFRQAAEMAEVLTHPVNRGKGCALKTGLVYIQKKYNGDYTVVTIDADGQHQIADAIRVCEAADQNPTSLILGSRGLRENVPLRSQVGNTITRAVFALFTGHPIHDTQTGLRAFTTALIPDLLQIEGDRYEYEMNVLLEFSRRRIPIEEVEISTIYLDNNSRSHFNTLKDSYRVYKEIIKFSASSLICFGVDYALYSLLILTTGNLPLANVTARIVSASLNFAINRKHVFQSDKSLMRSGIQYFGLAAGILAVNTLLLGWLADGSGVNRYAAKLITEAILFLISWLVQRFFIFRKKHEPIGAV